MKQKFRKLTLVHVNRESPLSTYHLPSEFDAIVNGTYSQLYGGKNITSYSLYKLRNGKIVDYLAWFHENQLTELPNQDREKAEELIEEYNLDQ